MSTVRRGFGGENDESPSIAVITAGKSGESVVESALIETPTCSPLRTPQVTPDASPKHTENNIFFSGKTGHQPLPVPQFRSVPLRKTKGLFTHCLIRELKRLHRKQRHQGNGAGMVSLTQLFVAVRCEVQRQSRCLGIVQTPQLSRIHWWRQKKAEGEFFF